MDEHVKESLEWSKNKYNHQIFELPKDDKTKIAQLLKPMTDDYIKKVNSLGLPGAQIVSDVHKLKDEYTKKYK
jgi:isopenicillin N synthase-like dioxygenase